MRMEKIRFVDDTQKSSFPETLEEQKKALETSEVLALYAANRAELNATRWCPRYHLVAPVGYLHDPNGLCYWKGHWHLFYQHCYDETSATDLPGGKNSICWGHVISDDLVNWKDLPDAIYPNPEKACWSGAVLVEEDRAIAAYFGLGVGIMVAVSTDPLLLNWEKVGEDKIAIPAKDADGKEAPSPLYDPCLFKMNGYYYLLSGLTYNSGKTGRVQRQEYVYRSQDLAHWEYRGTMLPEIDIAGKNNDGACPYFFEVGSGEHKRNLLIHFSHSDGPRYALGNMDAENEKFEIITDGKFSIGGFRFGGIHAPSASPYGDGGAVVVFNMNNTVEGGYPIMSLPQTMTLSGSQNDTIDFGVVNGVHSLRGAHTAVEPRILAAGELYVPEEISGDCVEISLEADIPHQRALELYVLRSPGEEEYTKITVYRTSGNVDQDLVGKYNSQLDTQTTVVTVDSAHTSSNPNTPIRRPEMCEASLDRDETVKLDVFLDRGMLEVFVNGKACIAQRVYPEREDSCGITLRAVGGDARILSLEKWDMNSIY